MHQPDYTRLPDLMLQQGDAAHAAVYLRILQVTLRAIFVTLFRVRLAGLRNLPPGQAIICANHLGWADPFLVLLFFPPEPRIYILADHNAVSRTGFRATMMNLLQLVVPLDPGKQIAALSTLRDLLARGGSLLIFSEGAPATDPQEGAVRPFHQGAAYLSVLSGVPVVPVAVAGTSELWLRRSLAIRAGKPVLPSDFVGDRRASVRAMTAQIERSVLALMPPRPPANPRFRPLRRWLTNLFA